MQEFWSDPDVHSIVDFVDGQPFPRFGDLTGRDLGLMKEFVLLDQQVGGSVPAQVVIDACIAGVRTSELLSSDLLGTNRVGWEKFVIFMTGHNAWILHEQYGSDLAAAFGGWTLEAMKRHGVSPDGRATALGSLYTQLMGIPEAGVIRDPDNPDTFAARGGNDARRLSGLL